MEFRHIAIEGPPGGGKSVLAERLAARLDATLVLEDTENPFTADLAAGRSGAAFQAQLFHLLNRHRQQLALRQGDLFSLRTVTDYLFDRDKIYAYLLLDDNELFIYQRLYDLLTADIPSPDLVIYLQTPTDTLKRRRKERGRREGRVFDPVDLAELNEAYNHYFFHYAATPLLVVETSHVEVTWSDSVVDDLHRQLGSLTGGTQYFVPRADS